MHATVSVGCDQYDTSHGINILTFYINARAGINRHMELCVIPSGVHLIYPNQENDSK